MCVAAACLGLALLGSDAQVPQISDVILVATDSSHPPHGQHRARVQGSGLEVVVPVPAVARTGDTLEVAVPGHRSREVQVPAGFKPGQVLSFVIPTQLRTRGMESSAKQILADSGVKATLAKLAQESFLQKEREKYVARLRPRPSQHRQARSVVPPSPTASPSPHTRQSREGIQQLQDNAPVPVASPALQSTTTEEKPSTATGEGNAAAGGDEDEYAPLIAAIRGLISGDSDEENLKAAVETIVANKMAKAEAQRALDADEAAAVPGGNKTVEDKMPGSNASASETEVAVPSNETVPTHETEPPAVSTGSATRHGPKAWWQGDGWRRPPPFEHVNHSTAENGWVTMETPPPQQRASPPPSAVIGDGDRSQVGVTGKEETHGSDAVMIGKMDAIIAALKSATTAFKEAQEKASGGRGRVGERWFPRNNASPGGWWRWMDSNAERRLRENEAEQEEEDQERLMVKAIVRDQQDRLAMRAQSLSREAHDDSLWYRALAAKRMGALSAEVQAAQPLVAPVTMQVPVVGAGRSVAAPYSGISQTPEAPASAASTQSPSPSPGVSSAATAAGAAAAHAQATTAPAGLSGDFADVAPGVGGTSLWPSGLVSPQAAATAGAGAASALDRAARALSPDAPQPGLQAVTADGAQLGGEEGSAGETPVFVQQGPGDTETGLPGEQLTVSVPGEVYVPTSPSYYQSTFPLYSAASPVRGNQAPRVAMSQSVGGAFSRGQGSRLFAAQARPLAQMLADGDQPAVAHGSGGSASAARGSERGVARAVRVGQGGGTTTDPVIANAFAAARHSDDTVARAIAVQKKMMERTKAGAWEWGLHVPCKQAIAGTCLPPLKAFPWPS